MESNKPKTKEEIFSIDLDAGEDRNDIPGITQLLRPQKIPSGSPDFRTLEPTRNLEVDHLAPGAAKPKGSPTPPVEEKKSSPKTSAPANLRAVPAPSDHAEISLSDDSGISLSLDTAPSAPEEKKPAVKASAASTLNKALTKTLKQLGVSVEIRFFEVKKNSDKEFRFAECFSYEDEATPAWQKQILDRMKFSAETLGVRNEFTEFSPSLKAFVMESFGAGPKDYIQVVHTPGAIGNNPEKYTVLISKRSLAAEAEEVKAIVKSGSDAGAGDEDGGSQFSIELDLAS